MPPVELTDGGRKEGDGEGAKSYDGKKAWSSINRSILSVLSTISVSNEGAAFLRYKCGCLGWFFAVLYLQESTVCSLPPIQK